MTVLSFSINAKTTYNIYKNDCLLEIRRSSDSLLIGSYNLDVLVWQSTISSDGFQLSDQIHSWSSPLHYIDNYTDRDSLFTNLMTWKNLCIAAQGGADSLYSEYSSGWLLNGDTIYSKIVDLNGDTLVVGSDTVIITGGAAQTLALGTKNDTSQAISISAGNSIVLNIRDADADSTNEIQSLTQLTDSTFVISGTNDTITISITGGSGQSNTASNVGTGVGIFKQKTGVDLEFKSIAEGANITFTEQGDSIIISSSGGSGSNCIVLDTALFTITDTCNDLTINVLQYLQTINDTCIYISVPGDSTEKLGTEICFSSPGGGSGGGVTLDGAYDYGGSGLGRTIIANSGAVRVTGQNGTGGYDGVLFDTRSSAGITEDDIPKAGAGNRFMYYARYGALRSGGTSGVDSTAWNQSNTGYLSVAFNLNSLASGSYSFSANNGSDATGTGSTAFGLGTLSSNNYSFSIGNGTTASGASSFSSGVSGFATATGSANFGLQTTGSGDYSFASGSLNNARSYAEAVFGQYNTTYTATSTSAWNVADRLFTIAIGASSGARENGFLMYKSGYTLFSRTINVGVLPASGPGSTPAAGDIRYDTGCNCHQGFDGTIWNDMY